MSADAARQSHELHFRPGEMPPMFGDTTSVLVVDGDDRMSGLIGRLLSAKGYQCTFADDGAQARHLLDTGPFAIALVDVMMSGESGLELVHGLLRSQPDLAVVMVTGVDDPAMADLALESGVCGYVLKPFTPSHLHIAVANAGRLRCLDIERRRYRARLERQVLEQQTGPCGGAELVRRVFAAAGDASWLDRLDPNVVVTVDGRAGPAGDRWGAAASDGPVHVTFDEDSWVEAPGVVAGRLWITAGGGSASPTTVEAMVIAHHHDGHLTRLTQVTSAPGLDGQALPATRRR